MAEVKAVTRYIRVQPRKAREVIELIQGKRAEEALNIIQFCKRKAARIIEKTLRSAIANAENNNKMELKSLVVKKAIVDEGPILKPYRMRPRARFGRSPIRKRTSHITITLEEA